MSNDMLNAARLNNETFEQYKNRQRAINMLVKKHLRGRLVHGYVKVRTNRAMRRDSLIMRALVKGALPLGTV